MFVYDRRRRMEMEEYMKRKKEITLILSTFIIDFFNAVFFRYSRYLYFLFSVIKVQKNISIYSEAYICKIIGYILGLLFYVMAIIYISFIVNDYKNNITVLMKETTFYLLLLLLFDMILYLFNLRAMIYESDAFCFVIICLLTNLVVYIKYKKNNIKIE